MGVDESAIREELEALNEEIVLRENAGAASERFFKSLLSDQLIFRRASGRVDDKAGYLTGLQKKSPTRSQTAITVYSRDDRAFVTSIVTMAGDDGAPHDYFNLRTFFRGPNGWSLECWYNFEL